VLLRWAVQKGIAVIPKSSSEHHLKENIAIFDFELDSKDIDDLKKLDNGTRYNDPADFAGYPIYG